MNHSVKTNKEESCLEKYLRLNPGKTKEDFFEARRKINLPTSTQKLHCLPDGTITSGISSEDKAKILGESRREAYGQQ